MSPHRTLWLLYAALLAAGCNSVARQGYHETQARENRERLENYAKLPFAIGRCGNIGKLESEFLDLNVDDARRDWYHCRGFYRRFQYRFKSTMEGMSDGRPEKQYARWSILNSAKPDDPATWPKFKERVDEYTKCVGMKLADKPLADLFKQLIRRTRLGDCCIGDRNTILDGVDYLPARIYVTRKFPKEGEDGFEVDHDASDENWHVWKARSRKEAGLNIRRHGPTVVLQFKLDQWAEWDDRAWARDEARKFLIVEDIPPFVCTMKSVTGVGTAWGPAPDERKDNPDKVVYVEDYGPPHGQYGRMAFPITTVTVTDFRGSPVDLRDVDAWRNYELKRVYGQYIYIRKSVSPSRNVPRWVSEWSWFRQASYKTSWVTDDGKLIVISQTDRLPKELVKAYLEKYPSAVE